MDSPFSFIEHIQSLKVSDDTQIFDIPNFRENVESSFVRRGQWNLPGMKGQIEKDLIRCDIRVNGERIFSFRRLCVKLGVAEALFDASRSEESISGRLNAIRFMAMLQQGAVVELFEPPMTYFQENSLGYHVVQPKSDPARSAIVEVIMEYALKGMAAANEKLRELRHIPEVENYLDAAVLQGYLPDNFAATAQVLPSSLVIYPTQIYGTYQHGQSFPRLIIKQLLELRHLESEDRGIPIHADLAYEEGSAMSSWKII